MLVELHIRDFAIIEDLQLDLAPGFTVFTGETGAGKSIIIDAVEMLLGGRADSGMVRTGAEAALLVSLADIGGVWPVMRVTAALTALKEHPK